MPQVQNALRKTNARYVILVLIFIATTFNYVDRATLSVAASAMVLPDASSATKRTSADDLPLPAVECHVADD